MLGSARGVVLGAQASVEGLVLGNVEGGDGRGIVPGMDERGVDATKEKGAPGQDGEGFRY